MKALFVLALAITLPLAASAQSKPFRFSDGGPASADALFIGEVHGTRDSRQFLDDAITMAYTRFGITNVVLELGPAAAYTLNAWMHHGDTTVLDDWGHTPAARAALLRWQKLYSACPITVHGIDFDRADFVVAARALLRGHPAAGATAFARYINAIPQSFLSVDEDKAGARRRKKVFKKARTTYAASRDALAQTLGGDFQALATIMENPATEARFRHRDEAMTRNLLQVQRSHGPRFLSVTGTGHTTMLGKKSLISRFAAAAPATSIVVMNAVCKNCYLNSYFGTNNHWDIVGDYEMKNNDQLSALVDSAYSADAYVCVNQRQVKNLGSPLNPAPTWYILFRDQPPVE